MGGGTVANSSLFSSMNWAASKTEQCARQLSWRLEVDACSEHGKDGRAHANCTCLQCCTPGVQSSSPSATCLLIHVCGVYVCDIYVEHYVSQASILILGIFVRTHMWHSGAQLPGQLSSDGSANEQMSYFLFKAARHDSLYVSAAWCSTRCMKLYASLGEIR